jgi:mRNA interferase MazF
MKKGDIVVVPFPFTDLSDVKTRPALVVSGKKYNGGRNVLFGRDIYQNRSAGFFFGDIF